MRTQRIFNAFVIIVASTILFLLPLSESAEAFKIDQSEDTFSIVTAVGQTTDNITLGDGLYEDSTTSVDVISDLASDTPSWGSYNATGQRLLISGMTANETRVLTVTYDIDALGGNTAIIALADRLPWFWLLLCIAFAPASLAAIFLGED